MLSVLREPKSELPHYPSEKNKYCVANTIKIKIWKILNDSDLQSFAHYP